MYPLTLLHLLATGARPIDADKFLVPLNDAMLEFGIITSERPAMFLAQIAHESGGFRWTEEIWGPTPTQAGYEGRVDLGNTQPGDGYRFRGRGLIQITGRANYQRLSGALGIPFDSIVLWLATPVGAARSAAHYWSTHGCNSMADAFDFVAVTRAINGGLNGLAQRTDLYNKVSNAMH
jgi:putative chitinase